MHAHQRNKRRGAPISAREDETKIKEIESTATVHMGGWNRGDVTKANFRSDKIGPWCAVLIHSLAGYIGQNVYHQRWMSAGGGGGGVRSNSTPRA